MSSQERQLVGEHAPLELSSTWQRVAIGALRCTLVIQGSVLLLAAAAKTHAIASTPASIPELSATLALIAIEVVVGMWLVSGSATRARLLLAGTTFSLFAAIAIWKLAHNHESCGCFGRLEVNPNIVLLFDLSMLGLLFVFRRGVVAGSKTTGDSNARRVSILFACGAILVAGLLTIHGQSQVRRLESGEVSAGALVLLEPDTWPGKPFELLQHIDAPSDLRNGLWSLVFFRNGCHVCHDVMEEIARELETGRADRIAMISLDGKSSNELVSRLETLGCAIGTLASDKEWFVTTPLRVIVRDGVCLEAGVVDHWES